MWVLSLCRGRSVESAYLPGGSSSIPGGVRDLNQYSESVLLGVLSYVVSGGGPDILMIVDSRRPAL